MGSDHSILGDQDDNAKGVSTRPFVRLRLAAIFVPASIIALIFLVRSVHTSSPREAKISSTPISRNFATIKSALANFEIEFDRAPTTAEGLDALVHKPPGLSNWSYPFLEGPPLDLWGHPFIYRCPGSEGALYDLHSIGPDGIDGTGDDIWVD